MPRTSESSPASSAATAEPPSSASVLAVIVCHNGENWLPLALSALRRSTIRPRHVIAVDTGSTDGTAALLAEAAQLSANTGSTPGTENADTTVDSDQVDRTDNTAGAANTDGSENAEDTEDTAEPIVDGVLTLSAKTGFASAVHAGIAHARQRWGEDFGSWIWPLHDDCAPAPDCLDILFRAAEAAPSAAVLAPLAVDWTDPRLIVEGGLSTDASGHRQRVAPRGVQDNPEQSNEVLAVPSAGALIRRAEWESLGGFDTDFALLREDIDFGWRVNAAGGLVLNVALARIKHARAATMDQRSTEALSTSVPAADRAHGLRTVLVNASAASFVLGLVRLLVLCVLRGIGFALTYRPGRAHAEFAAIGYLVSSRARLRSARAERKATGKLGSGVVSGLFTSRLTRFRNGVRRGALQLVRRRIASEAAMGRLPETTDDATAWVPPAAQSLGAGARPVGPEALPAGALRSTPQASSLRKPGVVAVPLPERAGRPPEQDADDRAEPEEWVVRSDPGGTGDGESSGDAGLALVHVDRRRVLSATVFAPPVLLVVALTAISLVVNASRLGLDLAGGRLLPVGELGELWSTYLAGWHPVGGGTATDPPAALAVLGVLGAPFLPLGGPPALVAVLFIGDGALAALSAYGATRKLRVNRWARAAVAAVYGLLPAATASIAQGRLDVVVAHILLPVVIAGIVRVLGSAGYRWLHSAVLCALSVALLGAFSPLAHALALLGLLIGFVLVPAREGLARRITAVAIVALLPIALLLPWPTVLVEHPALLLHGFGAGDTPSASLTQLIGLDPGGPGALPVGLAVLAAAAIGLLLRPTIRALPGLGVILVGVAGLVVLRILPVSSVRGEPAEVGYTGVPLLVIGAGLLLVVLAVCQREHSRHARVPTWLPKLGIAACVAVLLALATGALVAGRDGPLRADGRLELASSLTTELANTGRSVLDVGNQGEPVRQAGARLPRFGDDELAPVTGTPQRLASWQRDLLRGSPRQALTTAAASGVLFIVLPEGMDSGRILQAAGSLAVPAPPSTDDRQVLRLTPAGGQATLISPVEAKRAISGQPPGGDPIGGTSVAPVQAELPDVRVRVSEGPPGRLLVLAAEEEPGWQAFVGGDRAPIVRAWGHQVAVEVPTREAEVVFGYPAPARNVLLLGQVAALLFAALTVIPGRSREHAGQVTRPR